MKKFILCVAIYMAGEKIAAQNVGIGTNSPNASAILDLQANNRGFLMPRLTSVERNAIVNPANGLMVYDKDINALFIYNGIRWVSVDQTNSTSAATRPNPSYVFSDPQFLSAYTVNPLGIRSGAIYQSVSISENLIIASASIDYTATPFTLTFGINRNGNTNYLSYVFSQAKSNGNANNVLYCFDADSSEQNIYAVVNSALYKLSINAPNTAVKIADSLGTVAQIKVLDNNEVVVSTDMFNGTLMKVLPNGFKQYIAIDLRFPNYFDIFNNNYYITGLNALTGTVKKVTQAGVTSTILSDIVAPRSIVFDKNGNFVLQTNYTIGANVFIKYDIYNIAGQLIGPVNDASDNAILTINTLVGPMFVDSFNNLIFAHNGTASVTQIPNPIGPYGVWIVKMAKF